MDECKGTIQMANSGPNAFELVGYEDWTWEVAFNGLRDFPDLTQLLECEVVVRNEKENFTHRMTQLVWDYPNRGVPEEELDPSGLEGLDPSLLGGAGGLP